MTDHLFDVVADFSACLNKHDTQLLCLLLSVFQRNLSAQHTANVLRV